MAAGCSLAIGQRALFAGFSTLRRQNRSRGPTQHLRYSSARPSGRTGKERSAWPRYKQSARRPDTCCSCMPWSSFQTASRIRRLCGPAELLSDLTVACSSTRRTRIFSTGLSNLFLPRASVREKNILASGGQKFTHKNSSFGESDQAHSGAYCQWRHVAGRSRGLADTVRMGTTGKKTRKTRRYSSLIDRPNQWLSEQENAAAKGRVARCPLKTQVSGTVRLTTRVSQTY